MPDGGAKRTVSVTLELDAELVAAVEAAGQDLPSLVRQVLSRCVQSRRMTDDEVAIYVRAANERYAAHGSAAEGHFPG